MSKIVKSSSGKRRRYDRPSISVIAEGVPTTVVGLEIVGYGEVAA
jgi:hypothetical protein